MRIIGTKAIVSGRRPTDTDGNPARPPGEFSFDVAGDEARAAARPTGPAIRGGPEPGLGPPSRIAGRMRSFGMLESAPGFVRRPAVTDVSAELVVDGLGRAVGAHAGGAAGRAEPPSRLPAGIAGAVDLRPAAAERRAAPRRSRTA